MTDRTIDEDVHTELYAVYGLLSAATRAGADGDLGTCLSTTDRAKALLAEQFAAVDAGESDE